MYAQFLTEQVKKLTTTTTVKRHKIQSLELPLISALPISFSGNSHTSQTLQFSAAAPATTAPAYKSKSYGCARSRASRTPGHLVSE